MVVTDFASFSRAENSLSQGSVGKFTTVSFPLPKQSYKCPTELVCVKLIVFLLSKPEDFAVFRSEPVYHLGVFLFHVDYLFALRIFISRCARHEG